MSGWPRVARLDGRQRTKAAVMRKLRRDLRLPRHFGGNLDALFDSLTTDVGGPVRVSWHVTKGAAAGLGDDLAPLRRTMEEAAAERPDLEVAIRG
ncbi:MAG: barstar family protein [Geminicoccaceae bacterium]|nr:barstar family protein [Geminicoccaceae bacterium]